LKFYGISDMENILNIGNISLLIVLSIFHQTFSEIFISAQSLIRKWNSWVCKKKYFLPNDFRI